MPAEKVLIYDHHIYIVVVLRIYFKSLYRIIIMSLTKYTSKFFEKASKKKDLSNQSKTCADPKKIREDKSRTGSLTDMAGDVFAESLKSPELIAILFNYLRNVNT